MNLEDMMAPPGAGAMPQGGIPAGPDGKVPPEAVNYVVEFEADPAQQCALCAHFQQPDTCLLVAGMISPAGHCDMFEGVQGNDPLEQML